MTTDPTMPANAPAGSDSSEALDLLRLIERAASRFGGGLVIGQAGAIADALIAAGFTRAHHDGERVARSYAERHEPTLAERLALAERLYLFLDTEPGHSSYAGAPAETRAKWLNAADGVIGGGWGRERYATDIVALEAERDALAAKLDGVLRTPQWLACAERDAAIARAEAAEKDRDRYKFEASLQEHGRQEAWGHAHEAESRAAALAEVLSNARDTLNSIDGHQETAHSSCSGCVPLGDLVREISAALAGNRTGEG